MRTLLIFSLTLFSINSILAKEISVNLINDSKSSIEKFYKNGPLLIVNIATKCGYTPQLDDLEKLYKKYKERGLTVLGVPSNDFGEQTPEKNKKVAEFCRIKYGVSFPLLKKQKVSGKKKTELFKWLLTNDPSQSGEIKWNFEKFLISKSGKVLKRFESKEKPLSNAIINSIEKQL